MSSAADLTAPQLIALLLEHPGACGMLGLTFGLGCAGTPMVTSVCVSLLENDYEPWTTSFGYWLTGACVEKCDELHIESFEDGDGSWRWKYSLTWSPIGPDPEMKQGASDGKRYDTRLAAALAALERHDG